MSSDPALEPFVEKHIRLLEQERQAEIDEAVQLARELPEDELERRGVMLRRLVVADLEPGFGGRLLAVLEPSRGGDLPAHRFQPGDVVALRAARAESSAEAGGDTSGVVTAVRSGRVVVALDEEDVDLPSLLRLDRVAPDVTFRRMTAALRGLLGDTRGPSRALREFVFGDEERALRVALPTAPREPRWLDTSLDESQRAAVAFALAAEPVALIHGPPGTGKTTAVVELIRQAVARGDKVLACAPSNIAVDNLVERLAAAQVRVVRLGHPARILPSVRAHALDALVEAQTDPKLFRELRREMQVLRRRLEGAQDRRERRELRGEMRRLNAERRRIEDATVNGILDTAEVVAATLTGAADMLVASRDFDLVVIDEAAQAVEASCWIALQRGTRAVLAGDHLQLPPTIVSDAAARGGLAETLFHRLAESTRGKDRVRMLTVQYRMHETIMRWASEAMYSGRLTAAALVRAHRLCDLPEVTETRDTALPFLWIDTAGCGFDESVGIGDGSKSNEGEADIVCRHVAGLIEAGVGAERIGVITPYNAQVQILRERLRGHEGLEIDTVDGFQGREKEAIVLGLVRSNERGEIGFLADRRRLNVAVTRARRHVALIGDSATLANDAFLAGLLEYAAAHGEHRSAWEYLG
ncbi:MAG: IGHMBP2 family helicase [Planctomycetota bacterium]